MEEKKGVEIEERFIDAPSSVELLEIYERIFNRYRQALRNGKDGKGLNPNIFRQAGIKDKDMWVLKKYLEIDDEEGSDEDDKDYVQFKMSVSSLNKELLEKERVENGPEIENKKEVKR